MVKQIIGFTGEIAAGKTTSTRYLIEKHGGVGCRFSTPMRDVVARLYLAEKRENLQAVSLALRQSFGESFWSGVVAQDAQKIDAPLVAIDGIRRLADLEPFQNNPNFTLVYLKADLAKRFERITVRGENADDAGKTWAQFQAEQNWEAEREIRALEPRAQVVIDNNGSRAELDARLDQLITSELLDQDLAAGDARGQQ